MLVLVVLVLVVLGRAAKDAREETYECLRSDDFAASASEACTAVLKRFQKLGSWTIVMSMWRVSEVRWDKDGQPAWCAGGQPVEFAFVADRRRRDADRVVLLFRSLLVRAPCSCRRYSARFDVSDAGG